MKGSDEARALKHVIASAPGVAKVYLNELQVGWASQGLPAVHVYRVGGPAPDGIDRRPRYRVDVYARGLAAVEDAAEDIRDRLVRDPFGCSFHGTPFGMLDDVAVEAEPIVVPYSDSSDSAMRLISTTYIVERRDY